jgi:hypothetical protein
MGKCLNHPEVETEFRCTKHQIYLCPACARCKDPDLYCKFRPACPIAFMEKSGDDWGPEEPLPPP